MGSLCVSVCMICLKVSRIGLSLLQFVQVSEGIFVCALFAFVCFDLAQCVLVHAWALFVSVCPGVSMCLGCLCYSLPLDNDQDRLIQRKPNQDTLRQTRADWEPVQNTLRKTGALDELCLPQSVLDSWSVSSCLGCALFVSVCLGLSHCVVCGCLCLSAAWSQCLKDWLSLSVWHRNTTKLFLCFLLFD